MWKSSIAVVNHSPKSKTTRPRRLHYRWWQFEYKIHDFKNSFFLMKTFLLSILPKIKKYSEKLDDVSILTNKHWVAISELNEKVVFIFRENNNELLISKSGRIEKARWEYLNKNAILIERKDGNFLLRNGFIDNNVLVLNLDGTSESVIFIDESKYDEGLRKLEPIIEFLNKKYTNFEKFSSKKPVKSKKLNYKKVEYEAQSEVFNIKNYPKAADQLENLKRVVPTKDRNIFQDLLIAKIRNLDIKSQYSNHPELVRILEKPEIGYDHIYTLYNDKCFDTVFTNGYEEFIRNKFNE